MRKKKRSPTEILEKRGDFRIESGYVTTPQTISSDSEMTPAVKKADSNEVEFDNEEIKELSGGRRFSTTHVHTKSEGEANYQTAFPSVYDLHAFFSRKNEKTMRIAQQDPSTGKVLGYFIIKKSKHTPNFVDDEGKIAAPMAEIERVNKSLKNYDLKTYSRRWGHFVEHDKLESAEDYGKRIQGAFDEFADKYRLRVRYVPVKGHELKKGIGFVRKKHQKGIESLVTGIVFLVLSIFFSFFGITGHFISGGSKAIRPFGFILFLAGIFFLYNFLSSRKKLNLISIFV